MKQIFLFPLRSKREIESKKLDERNDHPKGCVQNGMDDN